MPKISHLEFSRRHAHLSPEKPQTGCPQCAGALYVRYDLAPLRGVAARQEITRAAESTPWSGLWRYRSVLPEVTPVTLGDGWTPLLHSRRYPGVCVDRRLLSPAANRLFET